MQSLPQTVLSRALLFGTGACLAIGVTFLTPSISWSALKLPSAMTANDRQAALKIVGFGTAGKILSDPYSLGGYSGLEFGISLESIPTEDLARLGNRLGVPQSDAIIPKFSIGKGLYSGLDFFIHFIPYNQENKLSQYGGLLRWSFFEAPSLPISTSLVVHMNTGDISNQLVTRTYGIDLIGGINVNEVALYAGIGAIQSFGAFVGGPMSVTDSARLESETVSSLHTVAGGTFRWDTFFIAIQLDRYTQSVLSGKLGLRF